MKICIATTETDVVSCLKYSYKLQFSIGIYYLTPISAESLLDSGAGLNFIRADIIHKKWPDSVKNTNLTHLHTPTMEAIQFSMTFLVAF